MRIIRVVFTGLLAAGAASSPLLSADEVKPVDFIVNQQVISDEVVASPMPSVMTEGGVAEGCANGDCGNSGVSSSGCAGGQCGIGGAGNGPVRGAVGYAGDLVRGYFMGGSSAEAAGCVGRGYGYPDLFYNYYTQGNCNATNAQMYVAPVPVPPTVGHTFYTYQPFMPEEMLYWHTNRYHKYYDNGRGMNHTKVHYFSPPVRQAASNFYWNQIRIPR